MQGTSGVKILASIIAKMLLSKIYVQFIQGFFPGIKSSSLKWKNLKWEVFKNSSYQDKWYA